MSTPPEPPDDRDEHTILSDLAAVIREQRRQLGMTQRQLANAAGVTLQHLQRIEYGRQNPTLLLLARLGRALQLPLTVLVARLEPKPLSG